MALSLAIAAATLVALFVTWRFLFFFRNPRRDVVLDSDAVLSPADGCVLYARYLGPSEEIFSVKRGTVIRLDDLMHLGDPELSDCGGWLVGVTMTPFDVHYNRSPIGGRIEKIQHGFPGPSGRNETMFPALQNLFFRLRPFWGGCEYLSSNERASYVIRGPELSVYVTQIADRWIRKIVTLRDREDLEQGDVFGLIRMGSQVDLFLPDGAREFELQVTPGQRVKAGLSVLLRRNRDP